MLKIKETEFMYHHFYNILPGKYEDETDRYIEHCEKKTAIVLGEFIFNKIKDNSNRELIPKISKELRAYSAFNHVEIPLREGDYERYISSYNMEVIIEVSYIVRFYETV